MEESPITKIIEDNIVNLDKLIMILSDDDDFISCFEKGHRNFEHKEKSFSTISARNESELRELLSNIMDVEIVHVDINSFGFGLIVESFELLNHDYTYLPLLVFWWEEWPDSWPDTTLLMDTRSRDLITPDRVSYITTLNLDRIVQMRELESFKDELELKVKERTYSLSELNLKLKSAVVQNSNHLTRMHQQRIEIEKKSGEIIEQNTQLVKSFKRSSLNHIKLQKLLKENETQRAVLEKALEENQLKSSALENKNKEIVEQKDKIEEQTFELESQRDQAVFQRDLIQHQQDEIKDNIQYSSRIQAALLPQKDLMQQLLPMHFVLNKPKDIVSGDFYWVTQNRNNTILSVADCTGHGISGAMMSMLGTAFLNEIVNKNDITRPNLILDQLKERVISSLHQKACSDINHSRDGMDIAMCKIDILDLTLEYAGANNPVYIIRKGELIELKPDKMPIGICELEEDKFNIQHMELEYNDMVYLFSDGFADQFGGDKGKKLKYKRFKELLIEVAEMDMSKQLTMLENAFHSWCGDYEQIDDVMVLGCRIV
jgi:serine phosphatase RsbU (regulator of sigma subunit)